jgi:hypothetical protein
MTHPKRRLIDEFEEKTHKQEQQEILENKATQGSTIGYPTSIA